MLTKPTVTLRHQVAPLSLSLNAKALTPLVRQIAAEVVAQLQTDQAACRPVDSPGVRPRPPPCWVWQRTNCATSGYAAACRRQSVRARILYSRQDLLDYLAAHAGSPPRAGPPTTEPTTITEPREVVGSSYPIPVRSLSAHPYSSGRQGWPAGISGAQP